MREARGSYECGRKVVWCKELKTMMFYGGERSWLYTRLCQAMSTLPLSSLAVMWSGDVMH